jgi:protein gp37
MKTSIEWTEFSWNPIRARRKSDGKPGWYCQRISPGCTHCYAAAMNRWRGNGADYTIPALDQVELYLDEDALLEPLRWRKPRNIFVCSMTDLYADFVPELWLRAIYAVMALSRRHTYMVLTKRPQRRLEFLTRFETAAEWATYLSEIDDADGYAIYFSEDGECAVANAINGVLVPECNVGWPLHNVREGTSICTQKEADELIPITLQTPAALRWLSMEPLLERVEISGWLRPSFRCCQSDGRPETLRAVADIARAAYKQEGGALIDWVVVGGESGPRARETDISALRSVVQQCQAATIPVFVKQMGRRAFSPPGEGSLKTFLPCFDARGGNPEDWPEDLRVRQFPEMPA